jgi:acetyl-CoA carboxylase carboxyl transferase subunit beta
MSTWFQRVTQGISTREKRDAPDGLWHQCPRCKKTMTAQMHRTNSYVCPSCEYHDRIGSAEYFEVIFDADTAAELFKGLIAEDALNFKDLKPYNDRLEKAMIDTDLEDAMRVAHGKVEGQDLVVACMDFSFIGGSMGVVVGEKIARAIDYCCEKHIPLLIISKSGGARMMEAAFSLMQMAKTSTRLTKLARAGVPYISLMTDPTTGGVTASYAMLGDLNIAEPEALIGFAGPRVIKETIKRELPKGFQTSEFLVEHGFLDFIVHRKQLKERLADVIGILVKK